MFNISGKRLTKVYTVDGKEITGYDIFGNGDSATPIEEKEKFRTKLSDWKFNLVSKTVDKNYNSVAEAAVDFDDSNWSQVKVPHDWSISLGYNLSNVAGYDEGYLDGGCGWYRTIFKGDLKNNTYLYFDGISLNSEVYVNGQLLNTHYGWFDPFYIDVTELVVDGDNTIAVLVKHPQPSIRWAAGSGLIREVEVVSIPKPANIIKNIVITYPNLEKEKNSIVNTIVSFTADQPVIVNMSIRDNEGNKLSGQSFSCQEGKNEITLPVAVPNLWDIYQGNLYKLETTVKMNGEIYKVPFETFGYRYMKWDANTGFYLNGNRVKIKGFCNHHENNGCLGNAQSDAMDIRKLEIMKESGCNAIRTSHNAASRNLINLCNKMGFLVMEEFFDCWTKSKKANDLGSRFSEEYPRVIKNVVTRDINAPSVFMWSVGNEIQRVSMYSAEEGTAWATKLRDEVRKYDTTRPVAMGDDTPTDKTSRAMMNVFDLIGVNYGNDGEYSGVRGAYPNKPIFGSETTSTKTIRGVYSTDSDYTLGSCLDDCCEGWGDNAGVALKRHMESFYNCGMFVWTAFDYAGESKQDKIKTSYYGALADSALLKKDGFYLYQSIWSDKPMIHIVPSEWENENNAKKVIVYSNCFKVDLFLNGKSLGTKVTKDSNYAFNYGAIDFEPGNLKAIGYDKDNHIIAQDNVYTSEGKVSDLKLSMERIKSDMDELVFVECVLTDSKGIHVPNTTDIVSFSCVGGEILGTDSGCRDDFELPSNSERKAFDGKCIAIIKPESDDIEVTAVCNNITVIKKESDQNTDPSQSKEEVFDLVTEQNNSTLNITGGRDINLILQNGSNLLLM